MGFFSNMYLDEWGSFLWDLHVGEYIVTIDVGQTHVSQGAETTSTLKSLILSMLGRPMYTRYHVYFLKRPLIPNIPLEN